MEYDEPSSAAPLLGDRERSPFDDSGTESDELFELGYSEHPNGTRAQTSEPFALDVWIASRYPALASRCRRVLDYLRGPIPSPGLTEPTPFLQLTRTTGRNTHHFSLDSYVIHRTRFLTSTWLFAALAAIYILGITLLSRAQSYQVPPEAFISCTSTFWYANNGCGLDGQDCQPFDATTFDFRCPADCGRVFLHNPRTVGGQQLVYKPLIVGGGDEEHTYRGDSFICAAAIQAGLIGDKRGGCGTARLVGTFANFLPHVAHGLESIGFPTTFPLSFRFEESAPFQQCSDIGTEVLILNAIVTALLFIVLRPDPVVLFWCLVCIGYWHVTLFSQPRSQPPDLAGAFGTFLPALFICYAFWRLAFRFVLPVFAVKLPVEGALWYLGPYWITVLYNSTFDRLPIDRLLVSDITARPGGMAALLVISVLLVGIIGNQMRVIRRTGWLPYYLAWHAAGLLVTVGLALVPGLTLRIHHYIIAMMLVPGTAFPTRLSAVYQGLLLGMFLNGAAAWGFDSILQTAEQLRRDAPLGSELPAFLTNSTTFNASIPLHEQAITWAAPEGDGGWDGFALLIDDVERYVGGAFSYSLSALEVGLPHFFRLAATKAGRTGDFTKAATLWPNGTWVDSPPGPS
ncbi:hypothetical protein FA95DRAFT_869752 [Auriscalpium vulgare]|uniref:Uncharacterized protein n=1 Tax=Auriscalpium vulgare TaxID=40419 RepID=A0ACB8R8H8_9AGAM|nr:hypothetical protein FA95DRAFT_869752 [Auriscalpium vulgare]